MQLTTVSSRKINAGYLLVIVMVFVAVSLLIFTSLLYWGTGNATITQRNNLYNQTENAAESATESVLANMIRDFNFGSLNVTANYYNNPTTFPIPTSGWPIAYQFTGTNGNTAYTATVAIGSVPTTAGPLSSQFSDLYGFAQPVTIATTATPQGQGQNLSATISQSIQFVLIPLFQFAIFYNMELEINPGAGMLINGHVHSNGNIWATGSGTTLTTQLIFANSVDGAGTVSNVPSSLDPQNTGRSANMGNGNVAYNDPNSPLANYDTLTLPVGNSTNNNSTNVMAILYPPPTAFAQPDFSSAYSTNGMIYLENAVDLIITNASNGTNGTFGTNITVYYQNPNTAFPIQLVPPDVLVSSNVSGSGSSKTTNLVFAYSFVTNVTFTDNRESDTVQALQIDVNKLNIWLNNTNTGNTVGRGGITYNNFNTSGSTSKGHKINSIYAYNGVQPTATRLPAVRMINGAQLPPAGLTVATPQPIYVKGDYNITTNGTTFSKALGDTTNTGPASLLADAITVLSANWSDTLGLSFGSEASPSDTVVNAAALEGIVPSNGASYSGGVENFLRLLENWSGHTLTYNGSIVVMFPSQYATNSWQTTGVYYNAPTRKWGFDLNFLNSSRLPPLTPQVKGVIRGTWASR
jgi:hypothetical protein